MGDGEIVGRWAPLFSNLAVLLLSAAVSALASFGLLRAGRFVFFANLGVFLVLYPLFHSVLLEPKPYMIGIGVPTGIGLIAIDLCIIRRRANRKMQHHK